MTGKRFKQVNHEIWQYNEWWCSAGGEYCADVIATALNKLCEENEQLKKALLDIEEDRDYYKSKASSIEDGYIQLQDKEDLLKEENKQLKKENSNLKKALWEAEENYLHEAYYDNPIREEDKLIDLKEDFKREYWND